MKFRILELAIKSMLVFAFVGIASSCAFGNKCLDRANLLCDISYTILGDLPVQGKKVYFESGSRIKGVPYSSVRSNDKFIGQNISLYSFLTALKNPKSDIYTKISTTPNSRCWYGVVCSSFLGFVYDLPIRPTTAEFPYIDGVHEKEIDSLEVCDFCVCRSDWDKAVSPGHMFLVSDVVRNEVGNIVEVEITEAVVPKVRRMRLKYSDFVKKFTNENYKAFSHPDLTHVSLEDSMREMLENKNYFDSLKVNICTNLGDKVNIWKEDSISINLVNPGNAEKISIFRNDTLLFSTKANDITLYNLSPGKYEAVIDDREHSTTSWIVCDANVKKIDDKYIFEGQYCDPLYMSFNDKTGTSYKSFQFSKEDINKGYFITDYYAKHALYPKIYFINDFGTLAKPVRK